MGAKVRSTSGPLGAEAPPPEPPPPPAQAVRAKKLTPTKEERRTCAMLDKVFRGGHYKGGAEQYSGGASRKERNRHV